MFWSSQVSLSSVSVSLPVKLLSWYCVYTSFHVDTSAAISFFVVVFVPIFQRISAKDALDAEYFWNDPLPCDPKRCVYLLNFRNQMSLFPALICSSILAKPSRLIQSIIYGALCANYSLFLGTNYSPSIDCPVSISW